MKKLIILLLVSLCTLGVYAKNGVSEKAFLGVSTSPLSEAMKTQLSVTKALLVVRVAPDSPAAKAGLKLYDIISKVDDVEISSQVDLVKAISSRKAGDEVELTLIRHAKEMKQKVTLLARPNNFFMLEDDIPHRSGLSEFEELRKRMDEMMGRGFSGHASRLDEMNKRIMEMMKRRGQEPLNSQQDMFSFKGSSSSVVKSSDGKVDIRIETVNGKKKATVTDIQSGVILFEGSINTEAEKKAMPEDIRKKVLDLDNSVNIK